MKLETRYNLWAAEVFDLMMLGDDDDFPAWPESMGPSPEDRINNRARHVIEAFDLIDMDSPNAGKELNNAMTPLGSNAWPQFILRHRDLISDEAIRYVMPHAHTGWNLAFGASPMIEYDDWAQLWREVAEGGWITDGPKRPTESLTIYTGNTVKNGPWIDWTTDVDVAIRFANMALSGIEVGYWTSNIRPDLILGRFDNRGESEVVIDIDLLDAGLPTKTWEVQDVSEIFKDLSTGQEL